MLARSPTSLDVYLAAHILLLTVPPFPDAVLQIQMTEFYPGLIEHARRIRDEVARAPPYEHFTASGTLLSSLVPRSFSGSGAQTQVDPADIQYRRRSLLFMIGALAMTAAYLFNYMQVFLADIPAEGSEDDGDDGEDEGGDSEDGTGEEGELASGSEAFTDDEDSQ
jgi:hypothetical protein